MQYNHMNMQKDNLNSTRGNECLQLYKYTIITRARTHIQPTQALQEADTWSQPTTPPGQPRCV